MPRTRTDSARSSSPRLRGRARSVCAARTACVCEAFESRRLLAGAPAVVAVDTTYGDGGSLTLAPDLHGTEFAADA
jgi:hypothetical protein